MRNLERRFIHRPKGMLLHSVSIEPSRPVSVGAHSRNGGDDRSMEAMSGGVQPDVRVPPRYAMARVGVVILVRHAHAGDKAQWHQDDALRPLSEWGLVQAASLVGSLAEDDISVVWSSPAVRCRQTVEPLAAERDVSVRDHLLLAKDAPVDALLDWVLACRSAPWVLCTHGEVFQVLLDAARSSGLVTAIAVETEKGAAWRVKRHVNGATDLQYMPPFDRRRAAR
jgi:phosphohistidine phosphatase SixA